MAKAEHVLSVHVIYIYIYIHIQIYIYIFDIIHGVDLCIASLQLINIRCAEDDDLFVKILKHDIYKLN